MLYPLSYEGGPGQVSRGTRVPPGALSGVHRRRRPAGVDGRMTGMTFARSLWLRIETINAVTYFGERTTEAGKAAGLSGFWMGYFGFRAAPLGPVGRGAVEATFFNLDRKSVV